MSSPSSLPRSIIAIVVGFVVIGVLSFGTDVLLKQFVPGAFSAGNRVDDPAILLLVIAYVAVFAVFGCWLCARLAPNNPMRHALILGALGLAFNVVGTTVAWATAPAWFHAVSILLVMPYAWLGGRLRERQLTRRSAVPTARGAAA